MTTPDEIIKHIERIYESEDSKINRETILESILYNWKREIVEEQMRVFKLSVFGDASY